MASGAAVGLPEIPSDFSEIIGIVFNNWTAMKLSVEHGMAGPQSVVARKLHSMVERVSQILASGDDVEWSNISDYLIETMDTDFSTILEDESSVAVAVHICDLYKLFLAGNIQELTSNIRALPHQASISTVFPLQRFPLQQARNIVHQRNEEADKAMEDDDGWTLVKKK